MSDVLLLIDFACSVFGIWGEPNCSTCARMGTQKTRQILGSGRQMLFYVSNDLLWLSHSLIINYVRSTKRALSPAHYGIDERALVPRTPGSCGRMFSIFEKIY